MEYCSEQIENEVINYLKGDNYIPLCDVKDIYYKIDNVYNPDRLYIVLVELGDEYSSNEDFSMVHFRSRGKVWRSDWIMTINWKDEENFFYGSDNWPEYFPSLNEMRKI